MQCFVGECAQPASWQQNVREHPLHVSPSRPHGRRQLAMPVVELALVLLLLVLIAAAPAVLYRLYLRSQLADVQSVRLPHSLFHVLLVSDHLTSLHALL